jgi:MYXO-CTERM domain-containing protein
MLSGCYTWESQCLTFPNACSSAQAPSCGSQTQCWFWLLAAAVGVALVVERRR